MPTTTFIAVQCHQCSTMQVKQQKKSSNKWCCVVCNEKQSVRKVFAKAFMAKEVRKFVQSFNMSRQFAEETMTNEEIEPNYHDQQFLDHSTKKRTDWSEYIDLQDEKVNENDDDKGDEFEPKVVTELPKELFKKPKMSNYGGSFDRGDGKKGFKPVFGKRNNKKQIASQVLEPSGYNPVVAREEVFDDYMIQKKEDIFPGRESMKVLLTEGVSKWRSNEIRNDNSENVVSMRQPPSNTSRGSKWSEYVTEDDEDGGNGGGCRGIGVGREMTDYPGNWNSDEFDLVSEYQKVVEDVHPDFL